MANKPRPGIMRKLTSVTKPESERQSPRLLTRPSTVPARSTAHSTSMKPGTTAVWKVLFYLLLQWKLSQSSKIPSK